MPELFPFAGARYTTASDLSRVTAPPYDVIDDDERVALERSDPHNAVRLILPRHDDGDGYERAARTLRAWLDEGVLARDPEPRLYAYQMRYEDDAGAARRTLGVIGALGLPDDAVGTAAVLPHERTLPKARSDRLALLRATRANLDPIWGLSLAEGLTAAIGELDVIGRAIDPAGTEHQLGIVDPARVPAVEQLVASAPVVIADGHHRFETAVAYHGEDPRVAGAGSIMTLVVELSAETLWVRPIHRLVHGLPDARARLAAVLELEPCGRGPDGVAAASARMGPERALGFVDRDGVALVHLPERTDRFPGGEALRDVDAARFDAVVRPALGEAEFSYRDDAGTCAALVDKGAADAAVLLEPVSVAQIRVAAAAGVRMPEKTTYFAPKPRTGMVFRLLD